MHTSDIEIANPRQPLTGLKQSLFSSLLSVIFLLSLLIVLIAAQHLPALQDPSLEVRQIKVALPPPPPPPQQPKVEQQQDISLQITTQGSGAALPEIQLPKTLDVSKPDIPEIPLDEMSFSEFIPDIEIFSLNQLDGLPSLLTKVNITMPASLKRRGVKKAQLRLDVTIDTAGKVTLNRIVENPHKELDKEIQRLVHRSKFSTPQKNGTAVTARFVWPIDISV